jgi:hypothetical protein
VCVCVLVYECVCVCLPPFLPSAKYTLNLTHTHTGANIIRPSGDNTFTKSLSYADERQRKKMADDLKVGDVVERYVDTHTHTHIHTHTHAWMVAIHNTHTHTHTYTHTHTHGR